MVDEVTGVGARRSMAFVGHQMVSMAAWVADREREVIPRRTGLAAKTTVISIPIRV